MSGTSKFNFVVSFLWAIADLLKGAFKKSEFQRIILSSYPAGDLCQEPNAEEVRFCKCRRHVLRPAHVLAQAVQEAKRQRASEVKQAIVADIEAEQTLVAANRELITRFEKKIQTTLARIWGEEVPAAD